MPVMACTGGSNGWYTGRGAAGLMVVKDLQPANAPQDGA